MLRIDNLKLPVGVKEDKLRAACAHVLRVSEEALVSVKLLRRSIDAREGVKLLLDIYENYGCVAASGVFVCDKDEVWYVENCSGTQYVAIKLNNNMIFLEPNMAVIGRVDLDDENVIASKDLIAVAQKAGTRQRTSSTSVRLTPASARRWTSA